MFEIGDYVLNATNGICKISEIVELDRGGHEFPLPQLRAAFQRASVPDPRLLPLPDENDEGAYALSLIHI